MFAVGLIIAFLCLIFLKITEDYHHPLDPVAACGYMLGIVLMVLSAAVAAWKYLP